jgi:hypothetical protein
VDGRGPEELDRVLTQFGVEPAETATLAQAELEPRLAAPAAGWATSGRWGCAWLRWPRWRCACTPTGQQRAARRRPAAAPGRARPFRPGQARVLELALTGGAALLLALVGVAW